MSWIFLALLASAIWATTYFIDEYLIKHALKDAVALVAMTGLFSIVPLGYLLATGGLPDIPLPIAALALVTGAIGTLVLLPYLVALRQASSAAVAPLWSLGPVFIVIFAWIFLNERLLPLDYLAIVLLILSAIAATYQRGERRAANRVLLFMGIAAFLHAIESTISKYVYQEVSYEDGFVYVVLGALLLGIALTVGRPRTWWLIRDAQRRHVIGINVINEAVNFSGIAIANLAVSLGPVSLVKSVGGLQPIFILLFTVLITKMRPNGVIKPLSRLIVIRVVISVALAVIGLLLIRTIE